MNDIIYNRRELTGPALCFGIFFSAIPFNYGGEHVESTYK